MDDIDTSTGSTADHPGAPDQMPAPDHAPEPTPVESVEGHVDAVDARRW